MAVYNLNITERCNLSCVFCAADIPSKKVRESYSVAELRELAEKNNVSYRDRVILTGGEPTIHPRFLDIVKIFKDRGAFVVLFTNGISFSDYDFLLNTIDSGVDEIAIPVYSIAEEEYNLFTQGGNWKSYIRGLANIKLVKLQNPTFLLCLKILVTKFNNKMLKTIIELINNNEGVADMIHLNGLIINDVANKDNRLSCECNYFKFSKEISEAVIAAVESKSQFLIDSLPLCSLSKQSRLLYLLKLKSQESISALKNNTVEDRFVLAGVNNAEGIVQDNFNQGNFCPEKECKYFHVCKLNPTQTDLLKRLGAIDYENSANEIF